MCVPIAGRAGSPRTATRPRCSLADDPQALDVVAGLAEDWSGDGEQLVTGIREILRTTDDQ